MIRIVLGLMVGGGFLLFLGFREFQLSSAADTEPQTISAEQLIANGPGDNAHVKVTGLFIMDNFVYEENEKEPGKYLKLWTPAIAETDPWAVEFYKKEAAAFEADAENPDFSFLDQMGMPERIGLVILTDEVKNDADFGAFYLNTELQGLVINKIDKLSGEELSLLSNAYGGIDADSVLVLEHNREPASTGKVALLGGGGLLLFLAGPGLFLVTRGKK